MIGLQETHILANHQSRLEISGFDLISVNLHDKYGRAAYIRSNIIDARELETSDFCDTSEVFGFQRANIYKPPSKSWEPEVLPAITHPAAYIGDFNSHHTEWGYKDINDDGEN